MLLIVSSSGNLLIYLHSNQTFRQIMIKFYVNCDIHGHLDISRTSSRPHLTHQTSTSSNRPYLTHQTSTTSNRPYLIHQTSVTSNRPYLTHQSSDTSIRPNLIHQTSVTSNRPYLTHQTSDTSMKIITFQNHVNAEVFELQRLGGRSE